MAQPLMDATNAEMLVNDAPSLQDAFKNFRRNRKQRKPELSAAEVGARASARRAADPEGDKEKLREKFIARAKKYVGVPRGGRVEVVGETTARSARAAS